MIPAIVSHHAQRGVSLFLAIIVLSIILAIVFGLSTILVGQIKILRGIGKSVVAIYAADTGVEQALDDIFEGDFKKRYPPDPLGLKKEVMTNEAEYYVEVVCCTTGFEQCDSDCGGELETDPDNPCGASVLCIRSFGEFQGIRRAIEVEI